MALDDDDEDPEAAMRAYMEKTQINKDKGGPRRTLVERAPGASASAPQN